MKIETLKKRAQSSTSFRGHKMKWNNGLGTCKHCGAWVQLNIKPLPNDIDIGGPAVAINCHDKK